MHIVPFSPDHLKQLVLQDAQQFLSRAIVEEDYGEAVKDGGPCFTAFDGDKVLICGGLMHIWDNRSVAWSLIGADTGKHFIGIYRAIMGFLSVQTIRRIEATVDVGFAQGHRMVGMLGFQREGVMRAYLPDGRDVVQYARVI